MCDFNEEELTMPVAAVKRKKTYTLPFVMEYGSDCSTGEPNAETMAAMREAERMENDPSVNGYDDLDVLFASLRQ